ncbi:D-isomer specific 2-hydroxyacid dehydrogenase family protein [Rhodococcus sp. HM1]|uniref:D-isomer specific 2-hydroxyacid dehydrogenase family protein n=1 Tax=unclassified Rhodococcus (in: high G+C Gram-positive bacteria) TaxID=192944 RepID=UPI0018CD5C78|nr:MULTISPECIES: D-isomer specific 2-hydroxyacid dehydrogenase family protein [unclassified Rhodococcus (in: high G+C Gram-positive bacteria)]MBH0122803.1 hydroxyacid dehydrogenase [Rhodococcus sp. CX]MCK8670603.1 D-isomer specific 2-hydroxyacid dehydrogenase family protein [Rhodococcus sp. HM1]
MTFTRPPRIAVGPTSDVLFEEAIVRGGGVPCRLDEQPDALVWTGGPAEFPASLPESVRWVQLPAAGVEQWLEGGTVKAHPQLTWTSAAGAFAATVAEHALALLLAGVRALPAHLAASSWTPTEFYPLLGTLRGATVGIVGAGGIGRALIPMLAGIGAHSLAVTRSGRPVPGATETLPVERIDELWPAADHFVIAAPATAKTVRLVGARQFAAMKPSAWVVNVARGSLVDTDALVDALSTGTIAGAGLDVTDPEPLPDGHPLWSLPNAIITPHDSNPPALRVPAFVEHVVENVTRFASGAELIAVIDTSAGY